MRSQAYGQGGPTEKATAGVPNQVGFSTESVAEVGSDKNQEGMERLGLR
jgi:hypothetical protein